MEHAPDRGDLVWLDLRPESASDPEQVRHEQAGRRPALVLSPGAYNHRTGLAAVCPVTSRIKGYPFEVQLPEARAVTGVVLADQVRNVDWRARSASLAGRVPPSVVAEVLGKLGTLLGP
jgi:mRNA interferase MazF